MNWTFLVSIWVCLDIDLFFFLILSLGFLIDVDLECFGYEVIELGLLEKKSGLLGY